MNRVESKVRTLARELLRASDFLTLDFLAGKCEVTSRSVQNHVKKLEEWLAENAYDGAVRVIKKPGSGIKIEVDGDRRTELIKAFSDQRAYEADDTKRRIKELNLLLFSSSELTIGFLADHFYTSRSVILRDMEWIDNWLKTFNLQLYKLQRMGIGISGGEAAKRNAISAFFDIYRPNQSGIPVKSHSTLSGRLQDSLVVKLKSLYPNIDIVPLVILLEDAEKKYDFFLTGEYFTTLVTHLVICIARIKGGNETEECVLKEEEYASVLETAVFIARGIEEAYQIRFPSQEIAYICLHLMGYAMRSYLENGGEATEHFEALTMGIIEHVQKNCGGTFTRDKLLYFGLLHHLKTSIYRIKSHIHISRIDAEYRPEYDRKILHTLREITGLVEQSFGRGVVFSDEELENITFHFMLSKAREKRRTRAVLFTASGIAYGEALKRHIMEENEQVEILDVMNFPFQLELLSENQYDLIISTVDFVHRSKPVASLQYEDRDNYSKFLSDFIEKKVKHDFTAKI
ncbi:MAG: PRD domain-containing protein [Oscillospiraceae bacterium]|nr:PRD domain-containing protein [Oscillospiraceae bacterium]